jgi:hypothetical protein
MPIPNAPSLFTATPLSPIQVKLAWKDNSSNEASFQLQRSPDVTPLKWANLGQTLSKNTTFFVDQSVSPEIKYWYRVKASNPVGSSAWSNIDNATTPPKAPSNLASTSISATQVQLSWTDNSTLESGFEIGRSTDNINFVALTPMAGANVTTYSDTTVAPVTTYSYRVRAQNSIGDFSTPSNVISITVAIPKAPSNLATDSISTTKVQLSWTDNSTNESGFEIGRSSDGGVTFAPLSPTTGANVTTYSDSSVASNTQYSYRVRAFNSINEFSTPSNIISITTPAILKPKPAGIVCLTYISPSAPGDSIPWTNVNVDGVRIRIGWQDIQPVDGDHYDWSLIDNLLGFAQTNGKFVGIGVVSCNKAPAWLYGGVTFTNGDISGTTVTSATAAFSSLDVGRYIYCDYYPDGYSKIVTHNSSTSVTVDIAANGSHNPASFSILARNSGGASFHVLSNLDPSKMGLQAIPWDPIFKAKWESFITAFGRKYDGNSLVRYVNMGGWGFEGENGLAFETVDINFFNTNAAGVPYSATGTYSAGEAGWIAMAENYITHFMTAFPTTTLMVTGLKAMQDSGGQAAMQAVYDWGITTFGTRLGIMNCQLNAVSSTSYFLNAEINNHWQSNPTGVQFRLGADTPCGVVAISNCNGSLHVPPCPNWGTDPCLLAFDAVNNSFGCALNLGCRFVETYMNDCTNTTTGWQTMLHDRGAALKAK